MNKRKGAKANGTNLGGVVVAHDVHKEIESHRTESSKTINVVKVHLPRRRRRAPRRRAKTNGPEKQHVRARGSPKFQKKSKI